MPGHRLDILGSAALADGRPRNAQVPRCASPHRGRGAAIARAPGRGYQVTMMRPSPGWVSAVTEAASPPAKEPPPPPAHPSLVPPLPPL